MWKRYETEAEMHADWPAIKESLCAEFPDGRFVGPGWYFWEVEQRRCPHGCCWDTWGIVRPASEVAYRLAERIKAAASELREARSYERRD